MATVSELGETWNTTAGDKTVVATPALNDLIVVVAAASGMAGGDNISVADNNSDGLGAYTRIARALGGGTTGMLDIWIRNSKVGSATSTTFTATITGDTGGGLTVLKVTGMSRAGSSASKQFADEDSQTENPPTCVFPAAALTANACIGAIFGEDNPIALTQPSGWSETTDTGWASPTSGIHVTFRSSGETGQTISWSGGATTDHCDVLVELDTSANIVDADGSSAGASTVQSIAAAIAAALTASTGLAASSGAGAAIWLGLGASTGLADPTATSAIVLGSIMDSAGAADGDAASGTVYGGVGSSTGLGVDSVLAAWLYATAGSSAGIATVLGDGEAGAGGGPPSRKYASFGGLGPGMRRTRMRV